MNLMHREFAQSSSHDAQLDPFEHRYGVSLPAGLRSEAGSMSWDMFDQIYSPRNGQFRLDHFRVHQIGSGKTVFEATIRKDGDAHTMTAMSSGPIGALTGMLYELGCNIEIHGLHQRPIGDRTATFLLAERDERQAWGMSITADPVESSLRAVIAAANRL
ncbi:alpha-isopropylmalate synthase regulatory domain-containing protein [Lolliginicoccus suaedae]|uniref:alpha-isopropylmalate synthase regulatory domain-containing protein n=1 Tax=Lolliginicoccus suaedae TaxID=2605429 RepID=UPI0011EC6761|nr:alpha-isopropylmalate synthase regulatory domain-containing protein [Lolliginicoccus suaedae]